MEREKYFSIGKKGPFETERPISYSKNSNESDRYKLETPPAQKDVFFLRYVEEMIAPKYAPQRGYSDKNSAKDRYRNAA